MAELNNENLKEDLTGPEQLAASGQMKKQPTGSDATNDAGQNKKSGDSKLKKAGMAAALAAAPLTGGASAAVAAGGAGAAAGAAESAGASAEAAGGVPSAMKQGQQAASPPKNPSSTSEQKNKQESEQSSGSSQSTGYKSGLWYLAIILAVTVDILIIGTADAGAFVGINEIVDTIISPTLFFILKTQGSPNSLKKKGTRWIINYIIKLIPFLDLLPSNTINVLLEWRDAKNYYESVEAQGAGGE